MKVLQSVQITKKSANQNSRLFLTQSLLKKQKMLTKMLFASSTSYIRCEIASVTEQYLLAMWENLNSAGKNERLSNYLD